MVDLTQVNERTTLFQMNKAIAENQDDSRRRHLGGSIIGKKCERELWYVFRWTKRIKHESRLLRLFYRGHNEEPMIVKWLKMAGLKVSEYANEETKEQYHVSAVDDHFGGSLDAILEDVPEAPQTKHLGEFKTHSLNSFKKLCKVGMKASKPQHFFQMQVYMFLKKLERGLYYAVCKNDDEVYLERVRLDEKVGKSLLEKAERVIRAPVPPTPIDKYQSHGECTYCDYKHQCASLETPEVNCRTCSAAQPVENGRWKCTRYNALIDPTEEQKAENERNGLMDFDRIGCIAHTYIPSLLEPRLKLIATDAVKNMYVTADGEMIENGEGLTQSQAIKEFLDA